MPRETRLPKHLQPMLAILTDAPFDDPGWVFESKWDGFRMVASIEEGSVTLYSRNGKIISESYRQVAQALEQVKRNAVLDGELVALDAQGISRFQLLQNALRSQATLRYYLFDVMFLDGEDLRGLPLLERKDRLRRILPKHPCSPSAAIAQSTGPGTSRRRNSKASKASWPSAPRARICRGSAAATGSRSKRPTGRRW